MLSGLGISFQNLNLLHFDQIISLKSLSINLFLLAKFGSSVDEAPGPSLTEGTVFREREREQVREREREKERERERERRLFKQCQNLSAGHCAAGVQLFKQGRNPSAGTVLQGCSCLSSVATNLQALCCRGAPV